MWTPCEGEVLPAPERCDLKDNDCDGDIDETPADAPACELRQGVCAKTVHACIDGQYTATCLAEYGTNYEAVETRCDGKDNDCDGTVDGRSAGTLVSAAR